MKITEVKKLSSYLKFAIPIGIGTTAVCFLMTDGKVIKVYLDTDNKKNLFRAYDMLSHLEYISTMNNDTYIGAEEILVCNGKVVGYIYPYIKGVTLKRLSDKTKLDKIYNPYEKLLKDTKEISDKGFLLSDVSQRNIILNDFYRIIDLDRGYKDNNCDVFQRNMAKIQRIILNAIFDLKFDDNLCFFDDGLEELRYTANNKNPYNFELLLEKLFDKDSTKKEVKKKTRIKVITKDSSYYRVI